MPQTDKKTKKARGPAKLASLTYTLIAELSGYSLHTVRNYAARGDFEPRNLSACLCWINEQRERRGWALIGIPGNTPNTSTLDTTENVTPAITPLIPTVSPYNPLTGEFN